jgi:Fur family ferric uptake transcriptional regulator
MQDTSIDAVALLRSVDLRVTRPRVAVLEVLAAAPHSDTEAVTRLARESAGPTSKQAVYDVLGALTDAGLVRRFEPAGSVARYELQAGDDHQHLVCRSCGSIVDVEGTVGDTSCLTAAAPHGFAVEQTEVIFWGRCPECRQPEAPPSTPS